MKIRAFVFEDNERIRSAISSVLLKRGYEVCDFAQADTCPLFLREKCPCPSGYTCGDLIITDIKMPGMSGLEFLKNQIAQGCRVKHFAVMSADWQDYQLKQAHELGCQVFNKPIEATDLQRWLEQCEKTIEPNRNLWDWFK